MMVKVGNDLVDLKKFSRLAKSPEFLKKIFTPNELSNKDVHQLAGMFAAKEAVIKALDIPAGDWHCIEINYSVTGRPRVNFLSGEFKKIQSCDLSISHESDLCLAVAIVIY